MRKEELVKELKTLPDRIQQAERDYLQAAARLEEAKMALYGKQCELVGRGLIQGKNEQIREAELWPHTYELRRLVLKAKTAADECKSEFHYLRNQWESTRLIAQSAPKRSTGAATVF
ncbi:hypothetical protein LJK88_38045 [Paenibacillus sp. P26]|nr:hypothetical protein LJK88_38045 [Paenibacillus sp. P26]